MHVNLQLKQRTLTFFGPNLPENGFWGLNLKNLSLDSESVSLRYYVNQYSEKTDNFKFLASNLPKNGFWSELSLDSESTPPIYMCANFQLKWAYFNFSA